MSFTLIVWLAASCLLSTLSLSAFEPQKGFDGDDLHIVFGEGKSEAGEIRPIQKETSVKQSARINAEARFAEACMTPKSAGGHCREMTADLKEVMSLGRGAKGVGNECVEDVGSSCTLHCRIAWKFTRKNPQGYLRETAGRRRAILSLTDLSSCKIFLVNTRQRSAS